MGSFPRPRPRKDPTRERVYKNPLAKKKEVKEALKDYMVFQRRVLKNPMVFGKRVPQTHTIQEVGMKGGEEGSRENSFCEYFDPVVKKKIPL